ncbi:hypothetical protein PROFUN_13146 [Planoprotostelium fungivorum]|uniref:Battenin n=1 Tax=Planoprotostelium fungivorum TaxID=1890364 RepID=A0A2P6N558_9EUKA|nr:hypothetical protein PROFUN_13146 [Planoprotostelium fungivorum]
MRNCVDLPNLEDRVSSGTLKLMSSTGIIRKGGGVTHDSIFGELVYCWLRDGFLIHNHQIRIMGRDNSYDRLGSDEENDFLPKDVGPRRFVRDLIGFFILGLLNNFAYAVMYSAASEIVDPYNLPLAVVVLFNMLPGFISTLIAPFFVDVIPYWIRVVFVSASAIFGFIFVALPAELRFLDGHNAGQLAIILFGVSLGSISSSFGEITFLSYSATYHKSVISAFSSGTGGAGIAGSFSYMLLKEVIGLSLQTTLYILCPFPIILALSYFFILSKPEDRLLPAVGENSNLIPAIPDRMEDPEDKRSLTLHERFVLIVKLLPFTTPLFLVYFMEYLINSLFVFLLFPDQTDIPKLRQDKFIYTTYITIYQVGVFISRSSVELLPIRNLWFPAIAQTINCILVFTFILKHYLHNHAVWFVFVLVLWEGFMGGAIYVNTYWRVSQEFKGREKEFCLGAIAMSYGLSITIAALVSIFITQPLCGWQPKEGEFGFPEACKKNK